MPELCTWVFRRPGPARGDRMYGGDCAGPSNKWAALLPPWARPADFGGSCVASGP